MTGVLIFIIATLVYLAFFVDWKETMDVLKAGGWAAVAVYVAVGVVIAATWGASQAGHGGHAMH